MGPFSTKRNKIEEPNKKTKRIFLIYDLTKMLVTFIFTFEMTEIQIFWVISPSIHPFLLPCLPKLT